MDTVFEGAFVSVETGEIASIYVRNSSEHYRLTSSAFSDDNRPKAVRFADRCDLEADRDFFKKAGEAFVLVRRLSDISLSVSALETLLSTVTRGTADAEGKEQRRA